LDCIVAAFSGIITTLGCKPSFESNIVEVVTSTMSSQPEPVFEQTTISLVMSMQVAHKRMF